MLLSILNKVPYDISASVPASFEIPFKYFTKSEIIAEISLDQTARPGEGSIALVQGVDYTLTDPGETGTAYRENTWDADAISLTIYRIVDLEQGTNLQNGDLYNADNVERMVDYCMAAIQQVNEKFSRCIYAPITDGDADLKLPTKEELKTHSIAWDATGENIIVSDKTVANCTPFIETLLDDSTPEAARNTLDVYSKDEIGEITGTLGENVSVGDLMTLNPDGTWRQAKRGVDDSSSLQISLDLAPAWVNGTDLEGKRTVYVWEDEVNDKVNARVVGIVNGVLTNLTPVTEVDDCSGDEAQDILVEGLSDTAFVIAYSIVGESSSYIRMGHYDEGTDSIVWDTPTTSDGVGTYSNNRPGLCGFNSTTFGVLTLTSIGDYFRIGHHDGVGNMVWDIASTRLGTNTDNRGGELIAISETQCHIMRATWNPAMSSECLLKVNHATWDGSTGITISAEQIVSNQDSDLAVTIAKWLNSNSYPAGIRKGDTLVHFWNNNWSYDNLRELVTWMFERPGGSASNYRDFFLPTLPEWDYEYSQGMQTDTLRVRHVFRDVYVVSVPMQTSAETFLSYRFFKIENGSFHYISPMFSTEVDSPTFRCGTITAGGEGKAILAQCNDGSTEHYFGKILYYDEFNGIAVESKLSGQTCRIRYSGVVSGLSGLEAGRDYYTDYVNSGIQLEPSDTSDEIVGKAISSTELLLGK